MKLKNPLKGIERRDFLKILSLTGIGSLIYSKDTIASVVSPAAPSRVVIITDSTVIDPALNKPKASVVKTMIDEGIKTFTGISDVGEAWKSIFPGITAQKVIAIKVNTLFDPKNCGTHPEVTYAVADGLQLMDFSGTKFPANNIIIFDLNNLTNQGYTLNETATGVRCFATKSYSTENYTAATISIKLSTIVTQTADYLINIAMLKHHGMASGVSLCLKNHFGTVNDPGKCHDIMADIGALSALTPIRDKQKFCIIDAIYAITNGGPSAIPDQKPNKIIMGQDIVAVDYTGRSLLSSLGLPSSSFNTSTHIDRAATIYALGTNDPANMETLNITTPVTGIDSTEKQTELFQNSPNPFTTETNIQFYLKSSEYVQLSILNYYGQIRNKLVSKKLAKGMHTFTWNGLGSSGEDVPAGFYICELKTKSYNKTIIIQKVK